MENVIVAMPTLRTLLQTANGLYRDPTVNIDYPRSALMERLSADVLELPVTIRKIGNGTYTVGVSGAEQSEFILYSRRRSKRAG